MVVCLLFCFSFLLNSPISTLFKKRDPPPVTDDENSRNIPNGDKQTASTSPESMRENLRLSIRIRSISALCLIFLYTLRFDLPTVILVMTDASYANAKSKEWQWGRLTEGWILSSFFWGYAVGQIFTGISISRLPRNKTPGVFSTWISGCVMASGALTLFNLILSTHGDWQLLCVSRAAIGLLQGVAVPLIYKILIHVTPKKEHQDVGSVVWRNVIFAAFLGPLLSSLLMPSNGWTLAVCFFGLFAMTGGLISLFFMREKCFIEFSSLQNCSAESVDTGINKTPWKSIFCSRGFWAILSSAICQTWCFWLLATQLPLYLKYVVGYDLTQNGRAMAAIYFSGAFASAFDPLLQKLQNIKRCQSWLSTVLFRKIFNSVSFWVPAAALILLGALPDQTHWLNFSLLVIAIGFNAFVGLGYLNNAYDMTKKFAGDIIGVTNVVANLFAISAPIVAALVVSDPTSHHQWGILLYITAAVYIAGNVFFVIFGSGAQQSWDKQDETLRGVN